MILSRVGHELEKLQHSLKIGGGGDTVDITKLFPFRALIWNPAGVEMCFASVHSSLYSLQSSQLLSFTRCRKDGIGSRLHEMHLSQKYHWDWAAHAAKGESQFTTEKLTAYELTAHFTLFKIILSFDLQFNQSIKCLL